MTRPRWIVEMSHLYDYPDELEAGTLKELCSQIQTLADNKPVREVVPPMGVISFRWEIDLETLVPLVCHSYFTNKHGKLTRFMRLRLWRP